MERHSVELLGLATRETAHCNWSRCLLRSCTREQDRTTYSLNFTASLTHVSAGPVQPSVLLPVTSSTVGIRALLYRSIQIHTRESVCGRRCGRETHLAVRWHLEPPRDTRRVQCQTYGT